MGSTQETLFMPTHSVARSSIVVNAPRERIWKALVDPAAIREYMFGTEVASSWQQGAPITWKGEWEGKRYEDKGTIVALEPGRRLRYTHFSPLAGLPDVPENYHTVTIELTGEGDRTEVALTQDNNPSEEARAHAEANWRTMLEGLKAHVEESGR
jgi:uncharacterized protein YndB with AHSA1/START domain